MTSHSRFPRLFVVFCGWLAVSWLEAAQPRRGAANEKFYQDPGLFVPEQVQPLADLDAATLARLDPGIRALGLAAGNSFYDARVGRWSSLVLSRPLIPGTGAGNGLEWNGGLAPRGVEEWKSAAWNALLDYLRANAAHLRLDLDELSSSPRISAHDGGKIIFIHVPRVVDGIPVRDNSIGAAVNHGNLILLGIQRWGDIGANVPRSPGVPAAAAEEAVRAHVRPMTLSAFTKPARLELVPVVSGDGIGYRLVWVVTGRIEGDLGTWEGLVDAAGGALLSFQDRNQYIDGQITGGAYPVSNDQRPPDGVEQSDWPMPFADFTIDGVKRFADTGGNMGCIPGSISTALNGIYLRMLDDCGAINETGTNGVDLGEGPLASSTDCVVPVGHSAGDTKSSRSGYYELNRIAEQARGHLGAGTGGGDWARAQLTANMNILDICNAFWDGATVNFFRSGGGCGNTGEIAAIFDHEWGHGMDNNGTNPNIAGPGEAIADIYAALRLNTSCVGRGFFLNETCGGYGDACDGTPQNGCTGVRDIDYINHRCDAPHTISWILNGFTDGECAGPGGAPGCPAVGSTGPCGRETHCEGYVMAETGWDLMTRDLLDSPFNYDSQTAHEIAARLLYLGAQPVGNWYTCSVGGGCSATGGYLSLLAVDDDNGNLSDGTPHMSAIFAAFERHEIHCATPGVQNSGCAGAPAAAPIVTLEGQDRSVQLTWNAVPGATKYVVYRGEGVNPCDMGKVVAGETNGLSFLDTGLMNGRDYSYAVAAVGASDTCMGPLSTCQAEAPVAGPNMAILDGFGLAGGDGDPFLDNCEVSTISVTVNNSGAGDLTNVRIVSITPVTHPLTTVLTPLPAPVSASLASCTTADAAFQIQAEGLTFDGFTDIVVEVAADELGGDTRSKLIRIQHNESDLEFVSSRTFSFEVDEEGWETVSGTFVRTTGSGANGTNAHMSSSSELDNQCDITRSPLFILTNTSTMTMRMRYDIELQSGGQYWDRANVSLYDPADGTRTVLVPSSGRPYSVPNGAGNGVCGTTGQAGWNGTTPSFPNLWYDASFNAAAFNPGGAFTDRVAQLQINFGTDESVVGEGYDFDQVAITDFYNQVPDAHGDDCDSAAFLGATALTVDGAGNGVLEAGESAVLTPTWTNTGFTTVAVNGTASAFTGPAGPTYDITDAAGAYDPMDPTESGACTDCYGVSITAAARPSTHWDAQITESLGQAPLQQGEPAVATKDWTLHVGGSFSDVPPASLFYPSIETVLHAGVTAGCGAGDTFCPADTVTRQQMAVFLLKAREGAGYTPPACTVQVFTDVPCASPFAPWINELSERGVTAGCGDGTAFCPADPTNRQQMAVFLLKTEEGSGYVPPACVTPTFDDVPCASPFAAWIEELVAREVTAGCGGASYCPGNPVARQQMAVFLVKTFGLVLYGP
jgi:hypothetical protein